MSDIHTLNLVTPWHSARAMSANSDAWVGLGTGIPDDTMYASPIVSTWIVRQQQNQNRQNEGGN